jgi:hypothetical protein
MIQRERCNRVERERERERARRGTQRQTPFLDTQREIEIDRQTDTRQVDVQTDTESNTEMIDPSTKQLQGKGTDAQQLIELHREQTHSDSYLDGWRD